MATVGVVLSPVGVSTDSVGVSIASIGVALSQWVWHVPTMCGMSSVSGAWPWWVTNGLELFNWVCVYGLTWCV